MGGRDRTSDDPQPGEALGGCALDAPLGRGGAGAVSRAPDGRRMVRLGAGARA